MERPRSPPPTTIVTQGQRRGAKAVPVGVGEGLGLGAPDHLGLYRTWAPLVGLTDAARNGISNGRPEGRSYFDAAYKLHMRLRASRKRQLSGVDLKDETVAELEEGAAAGRRFLLA